MIPTPQSFLAREGSCNHRDAVSITFRKIVLFVLFILFACVVVLGLILFATWRSFPQEQNNEFI